MKVKKRFFLCSIMLCGLMSCQQGNACHCGENADGKVVADSVVTECVAAADSVKTMEEPEPTPAPQVYKTPTLEEWVRLSWDGIPYREGRVTVNDTGRYALVVFLHGKNGEGTDNVKHHTMEHGHHQILNHWEKRGMKGIMLMPQCPAGMTWTQQVMKDKLRGLIQHYAATDSVDEGRIYICGTSNGALGGWSMIQKWPELFAGAMLAAAVPQGNSGGVPVCVVTGKNEGNCGNAMAALEANTGTDVMYRYRPNWNHGQTCQQSFRETACLVWLFGHRRR